MTFFAKNESIWLVAGIDTIVAGGININLRYSWRLILDHVDVRLWAPALGTGYYHNTYAGLGQALGLS
jgi:hypothetical protein